MSTEETKAITALRRVFDQLTQWEEDDIRLYDERGDGTRPPYAIGKRNTIRATKRKILHSCKWHGVTINRSDGEISA